MRFEEASKMKEGTLFDVNITTGHGGGWLNCYFEYGVVHRKIGGKLAASIRLFSADWKEVVEEDDWSLKKACIDTQSCVHEFKPCSRVKKLKQKLLEDLGKDRFLTIGVKSEERIKQILDKRFGF